MELDLADIHDVSPTMLLVLRALYFLKTKIKILRLQPKIQALIENNWSGELLIQLNDMSH
jgi:hypothetical protein